ncbi:helix-turn-helix transcriptional regulator [uncultured Gemmobacter sp.]|uniref:helix-turn-helix transcriptional regulator n=1 Tax=uncultured Gemmobacter sp. TaxID=1095917 RepID=UPI00338DF7B3
MMNLCTFLSEMGETQVEFAKRVSVSQGTISKLCAGQIRPSLTLAARIASATGGRVPVEIWVRDAA